MSAGSLEKVANKNKNNDSICFGDMGLLIKVQQCKFERLLGRYINILECIYGSLNRLVFIN